MQAALPQPIHACLLHSAPSTHWELGYDALQNAHAEITNWAVQVSWNSQHLQADGLGGRVAPPRARWVPALATSLRAGLAGGDVSTLRSPRQAGSSRDDACRRQQSLAVHKQNYYQRTSKACAEVLKNLVVPWSMPTGRQVCGLHCTSRVAYFIFNKEMLVSFS